MINRIWAVCMISFLSPNGYTQSNSGNKPVTNIMSFCWTPDGKGVCFAAIRADKTRTKPDLVGIFKYDLKTDRVTFLVADAHSPNVSADGKKMAYTKISGGLMGNNNVYVYDFATKKEAPLLTDTLRESSPSWSPDGNKLVYTLVTNREKGIQFANLDLWVIDIASGKRKPITQPGSGKSCNPVWAPGNKIVYFLDKGDNKDQIYLTDENGTFHTNLTDDLSTHNIYPSWSKDRVLYTLSPNQIVLMDPKSRQKSIVKGLSSFRAICNKKGNKIAFLSPGDDENPPDLKIYDVRTKVIKALVSRETLISLLFQAR